MVASEVPPGPSLQESVDYVKKAHAGSCGNAAADWWARISTRLNHAVHLESQEYMVARARRIWGRLGNKLRQWKWAKYYRARRFVAVFLVKVVKKWVHRQ